MLDGCQRQEQDKWRVWQGHKTGGHAAAGEGTLQSWGWFRWRQTWFCPPEWVIRQFAVQIKASKAEFSMVGSQSVMNIILT